MGSAPQKNLSVGTFRLDLWTTKMIVFVVQTKFCSLGFPPQVAQNRAN